MAGNLARDAYWKVRHESHELLRKREVAIPLQPWPVLQCVLYPTVVFLWLYSVTSSSLRFYNWPVAVAVGPLLAFLVCSMYTAFVRKKLREADPARAPLVIVMLLWFAVAMGCVQGDQNFHWYLTNYFSYMDSASYTDIDPLSDRGQSFMDAGQVYFREGTHVATEEMSVIKNSNRYCVAPIVGQPIKNQVVDEQPDFSWNGVPQQQLQQVGHGTPKFRLPESGTIDFWAVGMDCCNKTSGHFWCGQVSNPHARAGMRMLRDDSRPFYMLAVQAWTAERCPENVNTVQGSRAQAPLICLPAKHPLFFYWVVDPLKEVDTFGARSSALFGEQLSLFIVICFFLAVLLLIVLFRMGFK